MFNEIMKVWNQSVGWNGIQNDLQYHSNQESAIEYAVRECAEVALLEGQLTGNFDTFNKIQKHFGVK